MAEPDAKRQRFGEQLTEDDLNAMLNSSIPDGTKQKEKWAMNIFKKWLCERNNKGIINGMHVFKEVDELLDTELDYLVSFFILEVRNEKGERYKSSSLKNMIAMIQHYYNSYLHKGWSIFQDKNFQRTRNSLDLAMKQSRQAGCDRLKKQAEVVNEEHEEMFWKKGLLGSDTPRKLVETLLFLIGKNFALRSRDEHRRLQVGNITKHYDHVLKRSYLEYVEDISKTSKGGIRDNREPKRSRAYDNQLNPERCIVHLFDIYMMHRPSEINAFYLTPLPSTSSTVWYKKCPIGVNTLAKVVANLYQNAGIPGFFTNHSLRRGTRTILSNAGFGTDVVTKKTGHISRSEMDYLQLNNKTQADMSDSLNFCKASTSHGTGIQLESKSNNKDGNTTQESTAAQTTLHHVINYNSMVSNVNNISSTISTSDAKPTIVLEKEDLKISIYL